MNKRILGIGLLLAALSAQAFEMSGCPLQLEPPQGWLVQTVIPSNRLTSESTCAVALIPKHWNEVVARSKFEMSDAAILVEYLPLPFGKAVDAARIDRIEDEDGVLWVVRSGRATEYAEQYQTKSLSGLKGYSNYGKYLKNGTLEKGTAGYQGLYQFPLVLLSSDSASVIVWAFWLPSKGSQRILEDMLETIRLIQKEPNKPPDTDAPRERLRD